MSKSNAPVKTHTTLSMRAVTVGDLYRFYSEAEDSGAEYDHPLLDGPYDLMVEITTEG